MADHEALDALETIAQYTDIDVSEILCSLAENEDDNPELALAAHLNTTDVELLYENTYKADGAEYLVLTDDEADEHLETCLDSILDDGCVEGADSPYFDREAWKRDAKMDGRGHFLSGYDGNEDEFGDFFIYRTN